MNASTDIKWIDNKRSTIVNIYIIHNYIHDVLYYTQVLIILAVLLCYS